MAAKKKASSACALVPIQPTAIITAASQLRLVVDVDAPALAAEIESLAQGHATLQLQANTLEVRDQQTYQECMALRNDAARKERDLVAVWARYKTPLNAARQVVLDMEHGTVDTFTAIKETLTRKGEEYLTERQKAIDAAQRRMNQAAHTEQMKMREQADDLMLQGYVKEASHVMAQSEVMAAPAIVAPNPAAEGVRTGQRYSWECVDLMAFLRAVVKGDIDILQAVTADDERPVIMIDPVVMNAVIRRHGDGLNWAGIEIKKSVRLGATKL